MNENLRVKTSIIFREEGEEGFLFNPETEEVKILNSLGMFIWKLCDGKHSREEIAEEITQEYDSQSIDEVKTDLEKFLKELKGLNLINA